MDGLKKDDRPAMTLDEVARLVGGEVVGEAAVRVHGVAPLDQATPLEIALFADRRYLGQLRSTRGAAVLVSTALAAEVPTGLPAVVVKDAHAALPPLLDRLHPAGEAAPVVHPTAVLGKGVVMGVDVTIGPYAVVEDACELGDHVRIGAHAVLGRGSKVEQDSVLHPHVVLYPGTMVGKRVIVHAGARLGSDGFGYVLQEGAYRKVPQVGRCVVADDVEIGANSCIDRGSIGDTVVGRGSKLDNLVHLAHNVRLGSACAMAAQVGIAGSTRIGNGVVFGGQAGLVGHIEVGDGARITAQAGVIGDVAPGETVTGYPARRLKEYLKGAALALRLPELLGRVQALERRLGAAGEDAGGP
jgi:UDP-3-O-[3-hydroxymyristoyl] glucosamine N-acyltransferase